MNTKFKSLQFLTSSKDYFLLCNSRKLNVYYLNGELINEFKINLLSSAILVNNKIYVVQMNKKSIMSIDIFTGTRKRTSFRNDVKAVSKIYNLENKKLIIKAFQYIINENGDYEYKERIILYDIENDTYKLMIMDKDKFLDKVLFYNSKAYFMVRLVSNEVNKYNKIYVLNDKECIEEYKKKGILLKITQYMLSYNEKYFMMIDENNVLKVFDTVGQHEIFSYQYNKEAYSYLGNIFTVDDISYLCVYDKCENMIINNKLVSNTIVTKIYNLETGVLIEELINMYIFYTLLNHTLLYEIYNSSTGRSDVFFKK